MRRECSMKKSIAFLLTVLLLLIPLAACSASGTQAVVSKALGIDAESGSLASCYDTHSGNGDGTTCAVLRFHGNGVLREIQASPEWKAFPLDPTVRTLVYGVEDASSKTGPFLTDENGEPCVPEIRNGYYRLIDRQAAAGKATGPDILNRGSFNFTLGLYDTDTDTLYFCELDT